jgi:hypothetical protein
MMKVMGRTGSIGKVMRITAPAQQKDLFYEKPQVLERIVVEEKIVESVTVKNLYRFLSRRIERTKDWEQAQELNCNKDRCMGARTAYNDIKNYLKERKK